MTNYIIRRLMQALATFFPMSFLFYLLVRGLPLPPARLTVMFGQVRLPLDLGLKMRDQVWNLHLPWLQQYLLWLQQTFSGTFGRSFYLHVPVSGVLMNAAWPSLALIVASVVLTLLLGIPLGVYQALHRNSVLDHILTGISYIFMAWPPYLLGLAVIWFLAVDARWFPVSGMQNMLTEFSFVDFLHHLVLPVLAIAFGNVALYSRYMRTSMLDQLSQLYIRTAHAKGVPPRRVNWRHVLPNAIMPVLIALATNLASVISTVFIIEFVFSWPGITVLFVHAIYSEDYNVLMAILVCVGAAVLLANLAVDLIYAVVDHRVVYS